MNKKYIDFVPTKSKPAVKGQTGRTTGAGLTKEAEARSRSVQRTSTGTATRMVRSAGVARSASVARTAGAAKSASVARANTVGRAGVASVAAAGTKQSSKAVLGMVEDLNRNFVASDVPKRPLGQKKAPSVMALKAQKIKAKMSQSVNRTKKPVEQREEKPVAKVANNTFKPPVTPFINQEKVVKRPLSKNVYKKTAPVAKVAAKEEPKGPVTIITKPEKDAHVSVIVTIIITIILGAAAGTVAFLLLPK